MPELDTLPVREVLDEPGSVSAALAAAVRATPGREYARTADGSLTLAELATRVDHWDRLLAEQGIDSRSRVLVGLDNSIDHVAIIFAVLRRQALWIPVNPRLKGDSLIHLVQDSTPSHVLVEQGGAFAAALVDAGLVGLVGTDLPTQPDGPRIRLYEREPGPVIDAGPDVVAIMYTSGTTGPAKGVLVTDLMLRASALGVLHVAEPRPGDCFFVWEPIIHIGGAQVLLLPLFAELSIALTSRFSARNFWAEVAATRATHIHYLGGILSMLMRREPHPQEKQHQARIAWGAGADDDTITVCRERFGLEVRECYGMTETSSVSTSNRRGPGHGVGRPLPWLEVDLADVNAGVGAIRVRGRRPGLITPGYLGNRAATETARDDGWWRTGDLGEWDPDGNLHFRGRGNDSIRVRGENVSAWQVETVFLRHPGITLCAAVGIKAEVGEQEIVLLVVPAVDHPSTPQDWWAAAADRLAPFQVPRWLCLVDALPMTPSQRVAKKQIVLDRDRIVPAPSMLHTPSDQHTPSDRHENVEGVRR